MIERANRYWHTLRHLKPSQVLGRVGYKISSIRQRSVPAVSVSLDTIKRVSPPAPAGRSNSPTDGSFSFLNRQETLGFPPSWSNPELPLLWQFNLHYFDYLSSLDKSQRHEACLDWVEKNPPGSGVGWHPYTTSLRIINWTRHAPLGQLMADSLFTQASYLSRNIETHIGGNHILENARALMHAGCYFADDARAAAWRGKARDIYSRELPEQVLPDGGHFERSPMYHAIVLEGLLDVIYLLESTEKDSASEFIPYAEKMLDFLVSVTHPDGHIALFNDSTQEIAPSTSDLVEYGRDVLDYTPSRGTDFPQSGYFVHNHDPLFLVIDGGKIGPDHLPAHAHADIFSYELSCAGHQFVVDTGVFEYAAGNLRNYVRSTEAHNTIQIDDEDQVECWSSFRVARRYEPHGISFKNSDSGFHFEGTYSGWGRLIGDSLTHQRTVSYENESRELEFRDTVTGGGRHDVRSRIHLHPAVEVQPVEGGLILERDNTAVTFIAGGPFEVIDTIYCPQFGMQVANKTIVLSDTLDRESVMSYRFLI